MHWKISVLGDTQASLFGPRNDAVHRGQLLSCANVMRALEIAEELVSLVEADLIRVSSLRAVNRPQRHDLVISSLVSDLDHEPPDDLARAELSEWDYEFSDAELPNPALHLTARFVRGG